MSGFDPDWPPPAEPPVLDDPPVLDLLRFAPPDPAARVDRPDLGGGPSWADPLDPYGDEPGWASPAAPAHSAPPYPAPSLRDLPPPLAPPSGHAQPPMGPIPPLLDHGLPPMTPPVDFGPPGTGPVDFGAPPIAPLVEDTPRPISAPVDYAPPPTSAPVDVTPPGVPGVGDAGPPNLTIPPALVGFTALSANRVVLTLMASGARMVASDVARAWLEVPGARIVVSEGDVTRLLVDSEDAERRARVGDVVLQGLFREDASVTLSPSHAAAPEPGPMTGTPAAGWYADPYRPSGIRHWDGRRWTGDTA